MSTYTYDTFLNQYTDTDSTLQIVDTDGVVKFTINPYSILTTMITNNLVTFKMKSGRLIPIPFSTMNESKMALITAEERIQLLVNKTPNFIDKQVEKYVEAHGSTSSATASIVLVPMNQFIVFKRGVTTPNELEPNDIVQGIINDIKFEGIYLGGDKMDLNNYDIIEQTILYEIYISFLDYDIINNIATCDTNLSNGSKIYLFDQTQPIVNMDNWEGILNNGTITFEDADIMYNGYTNGVRDFILSYNPNIGSIIYSNILEVTYPTSPNIGSLVLNFSDINNTAINNGITDINDINQWNTVLSNNSSSLFESVLVTGNSAEFGTINEQNIYSISIQGLDINSFDLVNLNSVIDLNVSNNQLTSFDPSNPLPNSIQSLNISNNQLTSFDPSLSLPMALQSLNLGDNQLVLFNTTIPLPASLQSLNISDNQLTSFNPSNSLPGTLLYFNIADNQLTSFDPSLPLPDTLQYLRINNNQLTSFDPSLTLPNNCIELNISHNQLTSFDPSISLSESLNIIDVSYNQLTSFNPSIALPNSIHTLYLSGNQLTSFNPTIQLPGNLNRLDISYNQITVNEWDNSVSYISNLPDNGQLFALGNVDSIEGSVSETLYLNKNWTIV